MRRIRLHTKFITLLIGVSLVPVLVVAGVTLLRYQATLQSDAMKLESQLAATAAAEIRTFIVSQFGILDNITAIYNPDFPIKSDVAGQITEVILLRSDNFFDISVVDESGHEVARKNRIIAVTQQDLRDRSSSEAFREVQKSGVYVGPVYVEGGRPFFDVARSIVDIHGTFVGAVIAQVDARVMPSVVANISKIVQSPGRVYVVDDKGVVIAHPDISYVLSQKDLSALPAVREVIASGGTADSSATYQNENGDTVLGSGHPMTIQIFGLRSSETPLTIKWYVIAEQPASAVFSGARQAALFSFIISLAAIIIAIFAAIYFADIISRPIEALHRAALEFGKGNLSYRAKVESSDEIGDLAKSFNTTAGELAQTVESLKSSEAETVAERNKLALILSSITNAVIAVDHSGKTILFNHAAEVLTGHSTKETLDKPLQSFISLWEGDKPLDPAPLYAKGATSSGAISKKNLKLQHANGEDHYVTLVTDRLLDGAGSDLGVVLTFEDVTRELIMDRTKHEFVSIAAHQLRTPLTGLSWVFETLLSKTSGELSPEQRDIARGGYDAIHRMIELVNDLLDISQIEEGRFGVTLVKQSVQPVLEHVLDVARKQAENRSITFNASITERLPDLEIDALKFEFVLNNIVDNALKYTHNGGKVELKAAVEKNTLLFTIADTGIGIPAGDAERVFGKFFRSKNARSVFTDGSGLGLYVAKNIVEQHHGKIWFTSAENSGTTFFVSLPLPG